MSFIQEILINTLGKIWNMLVSYNAETWKFEYLHDWVKTSIEQEAHYWEMLPTPRQFAQKFHSDQYTFLSAQLEENI